MTFIVTYLQQKVTILVRIWLFLKIKSIVNLRKTWFFFEKDDDYTSPSVQKYFMLQVSIVTFNTLTVSPWFWKIGNCAILFKHLVHENEAVPRFTSWYGTDYRLKVISWTHFEDWSINMSLEDTNASLNFKPR